MLFVLDWLAVHGSQYPRTVVVIKDQLILLKARVCALVVCVLCCVVYAVCYVLLLCAVCCMLYCVCSVCVFCLLSSH